MDRVCRLPQRQPHLFLQQFLETQFWWRYSQFLGIGITADDRPHQIFLVTIVMDIAACMLRHHRILIRNTPSTLTVHKKRGMSVFLYF